MRDSERQSESMKWTSVLRLQVLQARVVERCLLGFAGLSDQVTEPKFEGYAFQDVFLDFEI